MDWALPAGGTRLTWDRFQKRLPVAVAVVLLHIAFLSIFPAHQNIQHIVSTRETFLPLTPLVKKAVTASPKDAAPGRSKSFGTFTPPAALPASKEDLPDLSFLLFSCGINTIGTLSREQQARCQAAGAGIDGRKVTDDFSVTSKAKHAAQYTAEVKEKNAPLRVPCTYTKDIMGASSPAFMVDPICAAGTLSNVFDRIRRGDY